LKAGWWSGEGSLRKCELPIQHVQPEGIPGDVILLHGGNDSYLEDFLFPMLYLAKARL
jgi:hypothetical protein